MTSITRLCREGHEHANAEERARCDYKPVGTCTICLHPVVNTHSIGLVCSGEDVYPDHKPQLDEGVQL